jgi:hypothetical protein
MRLSKGFVPPLSWGLLIAMANAGSVLAQPAKDACHLPTGLVLTSARQFLIMGIACRRLNPPKRVF